MKNNISNLALLGGAPEFSEPVYVGRPNIGDRQRLLERLNDVFEHRWLTNRGPLVQELEAKIAQRLGVRDCVLVCNATIGLEIAIRALGLTGEVIVPSMTFIATAHALQWQEITPVFCDIDPLTHNIDPAQVERLITPRTTGIIGVHLWGRPCPVEALDEIARRRNLKLIFDAAHAFDCTYKGQMVGNFGQAEVLSFHATKFFNTGEGGAIVTNDHLLAEKIRLMLNFGFAGYDKVVQVGTNGKMNEMCAALGLSSLESIDEFITTNYRNYQAYQAHFARLPGVRMITYNESEQNNYQYIVIELDEAEAGISRDLLVDILWAENIHARRYFYPGCHRMEPYRSYNPHAGLLLPHTERMVEKLVSFPTGTAVGEGEIARIAGIVRLCIEHSQDVRAAVAARNLALSTPRADALETALELEP